MQMWHQNGVLRLRPILSLNRRLHERLNRRMPRRIFEVKVQSFVHLHYLGKLGVGLEWNLLMVVQIQFVL